MNARKQLALAQDREIDVVVGYRTAQGGYRQTPPSTVLYVGLQTFDIDRGRDRWLTLKFDAVEAIFPAVKELDEQYSWADDRDWADKINAE